MVRLPLGLSTKPTDTMLLRIASTLLMGLLVMSACASPVDRALSGQELAEVQAPFVTGVAWLSNGSIVVGTDGPEPTLASNTLWLIPPGERDPRRLTIPEDDDSLCFLVEYVAPQELPDGRLGLLRWCELDPPGSGDEFSLVAYDMDHDTLESLAPVPFLAAFFSWNPTMERAVASNQDASCMGMTWVRGGGEPIVIRDGDRTFRAEEGIETFGPDCQGIRAGLPAWSPSGETILFLASPASADLEDPFDRASSPWNLHALDVATGAVRTLVTGIEDPATSPAWARSGMWVALYGKINGREGVWLVDPRDGHLEWVTAATSTDVAWSPEGDRLLTARNGGDPLAVRDVASELLVYDISDVLRDP